MTASERIRRHIQSHVVGYLALFVALSGTALALPGHRTVKSDDLARGAVRSKALADGAVKTPKLGNAVVRSGKLAGASVTAPKIAASAVTASALADASVTTPKLAEASVVRQKIAAGQINGGKLANGAVNSAKVADATLLGADFAAGQLSDGFVRSTNGSFSIRRGGRVYVTATLISTCVATCDESYEVTVDGAPVPGAVLTRPDQVGALQLTLIGITPTLTEGSHQIALTQSEPDPAESQLSLSGILLQ